MLLFLRFRMSILGFVKRKLHILTTPENTDEDGDLFGLLRDEGPRAGAPRISVCGR